MKKEIDRALIDKLCDMSKLEFNDDDKNVLLQEVNSITQMLEGLGEVTQTPNFLNSQKLSDLRQDVATDGMDEENVFLNANKSKDNFFVAPKVVD